MNNNNLIEVTGLKPGQRVIQVDGKWVVVGVGGNAGGTSSGGGGAFDIVKVTEYAPYVPAYPAQVGYVFGFAMKTWDSDGNEVDWDASVYEGLYTVTEDTKGCTGFGRAFKNPNGKWLYAFSYDTWKQATDESSSAQWCIADDLGYSPDSGAIVYSDSVSGGKLPNAITSWNGMMYIVQSVAISEQITAEATEAIPMVLKGVSSATYDTSTKLFTDGTTEKAYSEAETTPLLHWYYVAQDNTLIGNALKHPNIENDLVFHHTLAEATEYDDLGITKMTYNNVTFTEVLGRKCMNCIKNTGASGNCLADIFPQGDNPFTLLGRYYIKRGLNFCGGWGYGTTDADAAMFSFQGHWHWNYYCGSAGINDYEPSDDPDNKWLFIAYTYNGSGTFNMYHDCVLKNTASGTANLSRNNVFQIHTLLGQEPSVNDPNVYYSDIRLYRRCLTVEELTAVMNATTE